MTVLYTGAGVAAFGFGLALGWETLQSAGNSWTIAYLATIGSAVTAALLVGLWWFVGGTGEHRLEETLNGTFAHPVGG